MHKANRRDANNSFLMFNIVAVEKHNFGKGTQHYVSWLKNLIYLCLTGK